MNGIPSSRASLSSVRRTSAFERTSTQSPALNAILPTPSPKELRKKQSARLEFRTASTRLEFLHPAQERQCALYRPPPRAVNSWRSQPWRARLVKGDPRAERV